MLILMLKGAGRRSLSDFVPGLDHASRRYIVPNIKIVVVRMPYFCGSMPYLFVVVCHIPHVLWFAGMDPESGLYRQKHP